MGVTATWYGHACFLVQSGDMKILMDPFITGNPTSPIQPHDISADYILVSHGHGDHLGNTVEIAKRTDATVISNYEIHNWLLAQGVKKVHPLHTSAEG